jgi:hypothetical protein
MSSAKCARKGMMMNMLSKTKRLISVALATLVLAVAPVAAQEVDPAHLALARKYVDLTDQVQIYEVTVVSTSLEVLRILTSQNPEVADELSVAVGDTVKTYKGHKGDLLDQIARVYAQRFDMDELKEIVAFYESETGQKLAKSNFESNQQIKAVMDVFQRNLNVEFLARVRATLKERGIDV